MIAILTIILPIALVLAGTFVVLFRWVVRSGQLDDLDTPPHRILIDDRVPSDDVGSGRVGSR